jgi:hypothetical protein
MFKWEGSSTNWGQNPPRGCDRIRDSVPLLGIKPMIATPVLVQTD